MDICADLEAENDRLESILGRLDDTSWRSESGAPGWTVADVVLHLAQTDEAVVASAKSPGEASWPMGTESVDDLADRAVVDERDLPVHVFARWRAARRASLVALRSADPQRRLRWAAAPLKPATLATTRLAEHWAHGLDITTPLGIEFADTDRLRHIAWLGHSTLPYAFRLAGMEPQPVHCELTGPHGDPWLYGPPDAQSRIRGSAAEFCRVGGRRLTPDESSLTATGPYGRSALRLLRNYAR
ncbi:MAG: maleylpyruvate isomerase family mycothiol-dependent enzyme [Ilumatobacteraceae bacterium]